MTNQEDGNNYELTTTAQGTPTFRHLATGENLHGQAGPWQEAQTLYIGPSGLRERTEPVVIYDAGMGCAAQVLATFDAAARNPRMKSCHVVSFDLEKRGLEALRAHWDVFPYAAPFRSLVDGILAHDEIEVTLENGVHARWSFVGGDFRRTIPTALDAHPPADLVFYDFFSPASHPALWDVETFQHVFRASSSTARLFTYSCATAVRAALAAAGFFVGLGIPSGKKAKTTVAARRLEDLVEPLPAKWINTFIASHAAFVASENDENRTLIRERLMVHPQFRT